MRPLISDDILVKVNQIQLGVTQNVKVHLKQGVKFIEELFQNEPAAILPGNKRYQIDIQVLEVLGGQTTQQNWELLNNFTIKFLLPNREISFSGCQWVKIEQTIENDKPVFKNITITAKGRSESAI